MYLYMFSIQGNNAYWYTGIYTCISTRWYIYTHTRRHNNNPLFFFFRSRCFQHLIKYMVRAFVCFLSWTCINICYLNCLQFQSFTHVHAINRYMFAHFDANTFTQICLRKYFYANMFTQYVYAITHTLCPIYLFNSGLIHIAKRTNIYSSIL